MSFTATRQVPDSLTYKNELVRLDAIVCELSMVWLKTLDAATVFMRRPCCCGHAGGADATVTH